MEAPLAERMGPRSLDEQPMLAPDLIAKLAAWAGGDARVALAALEEAVAATPQGDDGMRTPSDATLVESLGRARYAYDRQGEDHYNLISTRASGGSPFDSSARQMKNGPLTCCLT
jgi:replication-associated recombination protein RarA